MQIQKLTLRNMDLSKNCDNQLRSPVYNIRSISNNRNKVQIKKGITSNVYWPTLSTPYLCPATWWESGTQPFRWALCAPSGKHEPRVINGRASSSLPTATEESIMMPRPKTSLQWLFISLNCLHTKSHIDRTPSTRHPDVCERSRAISHGAHARNHITSFSPGPHPTSWLQRCLHSSRGNWYEMVDTERAGYKDRHDILAELVISHGNSQFCESFAVCFRPAQADARPRETRCGWCHDAQRAETSHNKSSSFLFFFVKRPHWVPFREYDNIRGIKWSLTWKHFLITMNGWLALIVNTSG